MGEPDCPALVSTDWLSRHLEDREVRIVDVRWRSRYEDGRGISLDDRDAYLAGHVPNAVFAGMAEELSDPSHPVPDMLAPPAQFALAMSRLGIEATTHVIAYDNMGCPLGSARLWWALKHYGHDKVSVLDGGLRQWMAEGRPLSTAVPVVAASDFAARPRPGWYAAKEEVLAAIGQPGALIVDCLTPELYRGQGDRHLWGQRPGHIPGAVNLPYLANIDPALLEATAADRERILAGARSFRFAPRAELEALYAGRGVEGGQRIITYCGRGYAGACGLLAMKLLGFPDVRLYDGSWAEWSADPALPAVCGAESGR